MSAAAPFSSSSSSFLFFFLFVLFSSFFSLLFLSPLPVSAWSSGSGTCYASEDTIVHSTGRHPITPILGMYLEGLPIQYTPGQTIQFIINNTMENANV